MQKVFWTHGTKVSQESLAPYATLFCTGATLGCTGARDSWETFVPWVQKTFCTSPNHFRGFSHFRPLSQALWFATQGKKARKSKKKEGQDSDPCTSRDRTEQNHGQSDKRGSFMRSVGGRTVTGAMELDSCVLVQLSNSLHENARSPRSGEADPVQS